MTLAELDAFLRSTPDPERAWAERANLQVSRLERLFAEVNAGNPEATEFAILPRSCPHFTPRLTPQDRATPEPPTARFAPQAEPNPEPPTARFAPQAEPTPEPPTARFPGS